MEYTKWEKEILTEMTEELVKLAKSEVLNTKGQNKKDAITNVRRVVRLKNKILKE